ncbi:hypothetical protein [Nocardia sp. NPDC003183]
MLEAALAGLAATDSRELDRDCDRIAQQYLAQGVEPQFDLGSADFASDPRLICADRYWFHRFHAEPTLRTAVDCAGWLGEHATVVVADRVREKWAMGYAFVTRSSVETAFEIADATGDIVASDDSSCRRAYFATLYHAGKLRANFHFDELAAFLESSPLALAIGNHRRSPLFRALQAFAAFGSRRITHEHACRLFDEVWRDPGRTYAAIDVALNGLAISVDFDGHGVMLRDHANEVVADYPDDHLFRFRLATGQWLTGELDAAMSSIDTALALLPATGMRVSHKLFQNQYTTRKEAIRVAQVAARRADAELDRAQRIEADITSLAETVRGSVIRAVELVSVFAAVIAFAVGSLNVSLNGNLGLAGRLWIIAGLGGGLAIFALLVVGGTWLIAGRLSARADRAHR